MKRDFENLMETFANKYHEETQLLYKKLNVSYTYTKNVSYTNTKNVLKLIKITKYGLEIEQND